MHSLRVAALAVVVVVVVALGGRPADACGGWALRDLERKLIVYWLTARGEVRYDVPNGKQLAEFEVEGEDGELALIDAHGRAIIRTDGSSVKHRGKTIGHVDDDGLAIGKRQLAITVTPTGKEVDLPKQTFYWFTVRVTSGDHDVLTADAAMGLCSTRGPPSSRLRERQRTEIEARVRAYLGWRATEL